MYRFLLRPKWIAFHLLVLVGIIVMINLGMWQLRRLEQRQEFNDRVEARYDEAAIPIDILLTPDVDHDDIEWRPVSAKGTYLVDEQVQVVNRSQNGRAGDNIVVPLDFGDGRVVLVNRGFVPLGIDVPDAPSGTVEIVGRLRPAEERRLGQLSDPADGELDIVQRVDIDRLDDQIDGDVLPMFVDLIESDPAEQTGLPEPVIAPDLSEGNHRSYAVQWFIFAFAVAVGWVLAVRKSIATHRAEASAKPSDSGAPQLADDAEVDIDELAPN